MANKYSEKEWLEFRRELSLPKDVLYFNTGWCSLTLKSVAEAAARYREILVCDPVKYVWQIMPEKIEESRKVLAEHLNCRANDLLLMCNTTYAVNTIARSLELSSGDEVVMTDYEYHHFNVLWERIVRERGIKLNIVHLPLANEDDSLTKDRIVELFKSEIGPKTKALFFCHITSPTGLVLPVVELCALAKQKGALSIVDGAHAPGMLPVDLETIDADFYMGNLHKWTMGMVGSAFLHIRGSLRQRVLPLITNGDFFFDEIDAPSGKGQTFFSYSHEYQGTQDRTPLMVIGEALKFHERVGSEHIRDRSFELADYCRKKVSEIGFKSISQQGEGLKSTLVGFLCEDIDYMKPWEWFRSRGVEIAFMPLSGRRAVLRVSTAWFNTRDEIDRLVVVLKSASWKEMR